jgi:hypothetical protein
MHTDTIFYQIFLTFHTLLFELLGQPTENAEGDHFSARDELESLAIGKEILQELRSQIESVLQKNPELANILLSKNIEKFKTEFTNKLNSNTPPFFSP